jgi:SseB protein N-terminal domain
MLPRPSGQVLPARLGYVAAKNIPDPGFPDDDGSADARLAAALAGYAEDPAAEPAVLAALPGVRLFVPVVAMLGEAEEGPSEARPGVALKAGGGLRREKTSEMAVPTIQAPDARRALPAFTSTETLARWRPDARPVAVRLARALRAVAHEKADTLLIDLAGPAPYALAGPALRALAHGRAGADPLADPTIRRAVWDAVAAEPGVVRAYLTRADTADGTLGLVLAPSAAVQDVARAVAHALAADEILRGGLVKGLDLALLPADARLAAEPIFVR